MLLSLIIGQRSFRRASAAAVLVIVSLAFAGEISAQTVVYRPDAPRANWRVQATQAFASSDSAAFQTGLTTATDIAPINVSANSTWTATFRVPATPVGGMLTFSYAHTNKSSTVGYSAQALTSLDSTDGVNGTWVSLPLTLDRVTSRSANKLQRLNLDVSARWVRLTITTPANGAGSVRDLALYQFDPAGRDDYWLCIGASLQERGVNPGLFKNHVRALTGYDPVIFNVALSGSDTDDWNGSPTNRVQTVLNAHPRARYVVIHLAGNNVTDIRPYVDVNTRPEDQNVRDDLSAILARVINAGRYPLMSRLSYRDYPAPNPVNAGANQENGSLPYNVNIVDPLIAAYLPDQYDTVLGRPRIDAYQYIFDRPQLLSVDGIHLNNNDDEFIWSTAIWGEMAARIVYGSAFPTIVTQPASVSALAGDRVRLSVSATGNNLAYQWLRNGVEVAGATSSSLVLNSLSSANIGNYTVRISGNGGPVLPSAPAIVSTPAVVALTQPPALATRRILLDFGPTAVANPTSGLHWNQITQQLAGTAAAPGALIDTDGVAVSGVGLTYLAGFGGSFTTGAAAASGYPTNATVDGFWVNGTGTVVNGGAPVSKTATLVFTGLNPALSYELSFFGNRGSSSPDNRRTARFTVNQDTALRVFLDTAVNTSTASLAGLSATPAGELRIDMSARDETNTERTYAYLNVLTLTSRLFGETFNSWRDDLLPAASVPAGLRTASADADSDGVPNLLEYFTGRDPLLPSGTVPWSAEPTTTPSGAPAFAFDFRRARDLHAVHHFLVSTDLVNWEVAPATETVLDPDPDGTGAVELRRAIVPSPAGPRAFIRLRVTHY